MRVHIDLGVALQWLPLDPRQGGQRLGGTERLALRLARELAARQHVVTFRFGGTVGEHSGVLFIPGNERPPAADVWVLVEVDDPPDLDASRVVRWSHTVQWPRSTDGDAVVAVSDYHARRLHDRLGDVRIDAICGGVDLPPPLERDHDRFLYASSPDRGLHRLLTIWPRLWERWHLPLAITYDVRGAFERWLGHPGPLADRLRMIAPLLDQPGVLPQPWLSEDRLADLRARSVAMLYPLDPIKADSELYSLSVLEACAAGCVPVLSPVDCLPDVYGGVARFVEPGRAVYDADAWLAAIDEVTDQRAERAAAARAFAAQRTWTTFADQWEGLLQGVLARTGALRAPRTAMDDSPSREPAPAWRPPLLRA